MIQVSEILKNIKRIRHDKRITQKQMADHLNIAYGTYRDIESQRIRLSLDNFLIICNVLEISPLKLLKDSNNENFILFEDKDISDLNRILDKINKQSQRNN